MSRLLNVKVGFALFILLIFSYAAFEVRHMVLGARIFPIAIAFPAVLLGLIQLYRGIRIALDPSRSQGDERVIDVAADDSLTQAVVYARGLRYFLWLLGLYIAIYLIGFKIAIPVYFILFMRIEGKLTWPRILLITVFSLYIIYFHFQKLLGVFWPESLLQNVGWLPPWLFQ